MDNLYGTYRNGMLDHICGTEGVTAICLAELFVSSFRFWNENRILRLQGKMASFLLFAILPTISSCYCCLVVQHISIYVDISYVELI